MAENPEKDSDALDEMKNEEETAKPDKQNPSSSSDSDSEEEDTVDDHRFEALEKELAENPSNYDTHVQYIKALRKLGDVEKLRQAREAMNSIFPLTHTMWSEWAKDEWSLANGKEAYVEVEKLYERGVNEYLSVSLWLDYLNFVEEHDPSVLECSPDGLLKMRNLFERALTAAGLHVVEGSKIWEAYIEFEQVLLDGVDCSGSEAEKQVQRVRSIFHRQLSVPLADSRSTLLAYKAWEAEQGKTHESNSCDTDGIPSHVASAYQKAMEMYNAHVYHEEQISRQDASDTERLQYFLTYLKFEQSAGDPARVQILYERAVAEFPVSSDLWLDYARYLEQNLKVPKIIMGVYSRATKNCPWTGKLWVQYLLSLERNRTSEEELSAVFEQSLLCTFTSFEEYLDLFLTRIDGLRRRFSLAGSTDYILDYAIIRDTFQRAADYLSPHLKNTEGLLLMYAYWARLEWNLGKDLVAARGVWESLLKISGMLEAWEGYVKMEIETGHVDAARSIYKRCYSKRFFGTGSEEICHSWLRFEREFGTLEDYDHAVKKVTPRLEELQLFKSQQESKGVAESVHQKNDNPAKRTTQKRKTDTRLTEEQPTPKRHRGTVDNLTQASGTSSTQKLTGGNDVGGSSNPKTIKDESSNEQQIKHSTKKEMYRDQCTAFISNLSFQVNEEQLRNFFSDVGGVTAIRILRDKFNGKSRGLAYVDFANAEKLAAAVAKNKKTLLGKKVSIVVSNPERNRSRESSGSTKEHGGKGAETASDSGGVVEGSNSTKAADVPKESVAPHGASTSASHRRGDKVQLKGKNTFAVPRTVVRALGHSKTEPKKDEANDETPKSNDEFRNMLLKK